MYFGLTQSHVVALQEIENEIAFHSIFDKNEWEVFLSSRNSKQRTGFAIRRDFGASVKIQQQADYAALHTLDGLRYGTDIKVIYPDNTTIRLLSIHLKSDCFDNDDLSEDSSQGWYENACQRLGSQIQPLKKWIVARIDEGVPFMVVEDWNRRMSIPSDTFWAKLTDNLNESIDTTGGMYRYAMCNPKYPNPIDHIVIGGDVEETPNSFIEIPLSTSDLEYRKQISDHCPISVEIKVP